MSLDPNCIFCKIIKNQIPASRVLVTDRVVAFLDINPVNHGHILLVPREHYPTLADLPEDLAADAASHLPALCRAVRAATKADGLNVIVNLGRIAGQTIDHVHWHIIPRFHNDGVHWPWPHKPYADDEMGQLRFRIARELGTGPAED
ncbi:MAG: HIT family protein [Isosphaeraceae bacterium]|nr:HIT family protein [Isosphaeraceae bacterium]